MFGTKSASRPSVIRQVQQVRFKRKAAYPEKYTPIVPNQTGKKDHSSYFQRAIKAWLGPKNLWGEYHRNKYYYPPQNHKPNYIVVDGHTVVGGKQTESGRPAARSKRDPSLHPFPENLECKTALMIPDTLKLAIYEDATLNDMKHQSIAQKYGIKLARVEAIIRLHKIEQSWQETNKVSKDLDHFSQVMYKMFPLYTPPVNGENLTEIPTPSKTLHQRFLTISESEPFGPVDAAKIFELEPASETLQNLTEIQEHQGHSSDSKINKVIVGTQKEGDRTAFKFTQAKSGNVGFRYGASKRDRKKDRAIGFDRVGNLVNMV